MQGLALLVKQHLKCDPHGGDPYVFRGCAGGLIKVIWHDGIGMSLYAKRLGKGRFVWPSTVDGVVSLTPGQLGYMLEIGTGAAALMPLFQRLQVHVLAAERPHGDDTTVPVLAKGKTDTGRLWVHVRDGAPGTVRNFVREAIGWNGKDHRYGDRQGHVGPVACGA